MTEPMICASCQKPISLTEAHDRYDIITTSGGITVYYHQGCSIPRPPSPVS